MMMKFIVKMNFVLLVMSASVTLNAQDKFDTYRNQNVQEKLFVHIDRSFYQVGETMWFKIYVVDGSLHKPLALSAVAYLEVIDNANTPILQTKIQLKDGKGDGSLLLPPTINTGNYTVRAYTNWMKNSSAEFYYHQSITILNVMRKPLEETSRTVSTSDYDVQFFPEGGHLVSDITSRVAFRATDKNGNGIDFRGAVVNANNDTIVKFRPTRFGIGSFSFTPVSSQSYRAVINGKTYPLPSFESQGYVMTVIDSANHLLVSVTSNLPNESIHLLAHTRNQVVISQSRQIINNKATFFIDKSAMKDGITHITLFDHNGNPVCERLSFKRPTQNLAINAKSNNDNYTTRKNVDIELETSIPANLSVAVFRSDSLQHQETPNIESYLLLTSDLRGTIESASSYFYQTGKESDEALDNLMLTHGWTRFNWKDILTPTEEKIQYMSEHRSHIITAKIIDEYTKVPTPQINTFLSTPGTGVHLYASRSSDRGEVMFEVKDFFDQNRIVLQTNLLQDSTYKIELVSPFSTNFSSSRPRPFQPTNYSNARESILSHSIHTQAQYIFYSDSVRSSKIKKDTTAFYGTPNKHYKLDDYTRFTSMEDVMREYVASLTVRKKSGKLQFWVLDELSGFSFKGSSAVLVDGVPIFDTQKIMDLDPLKVKSLDIINRRYFIGASIFDGIVSYKTYNGDLSDFAFDPKVLIQNYEGVQSQREFYSPKYNTTKDLESRLPDFRELLYWNANVITGKDDKSHLEFYTSDQPGKYKVVIQGISSQGIAGQTSFTFEIIPTE